MTYRSEGVARTCAVCAAPVVAGEWMMDFFRERGGPVEWAHERCVRRAMEKWLDKKRKETE